MGNLLRKEFGLWWKTGLWVKQILLWTALVNGMVFVTRLIAAVVPEAEMAGDPYLSILDTFFGMSGLIPVIGVVLALQDGIIREGRWDLQPWHCCTLSIRNSDPGLARRHPGTVLSMKRRLRSARVWIYRVTSRMPVHTRVSGALTILAVARHRAAGVNRGR